MSDSTRRWNKELVSQAITAIQLRQNTWIGWVLFLKIQREWRVDKPGNGHAAALWVSLHRRLAANPGMRFPRSADMPSPYPDNAHSYQSEAPGVKAQN